MHYPRNDPKLFAKSSAVSSPTCGMESPTRNLASVTVRAFSIAASILSADFSANLGSASRSPFSKVKNVPKVLSKSAPTYKWSGTGGNLKAPLTVEKKTPPTALAKIRSAHGR